MAVCKMDCFNCEYSDCINDDITETEKAEQNMYDSNITSNNRGIFKRGHSEKSRKKKLYFGQ